MIEESHPGDRVVLSGNWAGQSDWEVTMSKMQHFGIAYADGGQIVGVGAPRGTEESALAQAQKIAADQYMVVEAHSKAEAREVAQTVIDATLATDEFAPTAAELAEAAALRETLDDPEVAAKAREPRTAPKTGTWYGCALDADGEVMVTESAYSGPELAREGALATLPNGPHTVVAIQGRSRDGALVTFEALADEERKELDGSELAMARGARGPVTSLTDRRKVGVHADAFYVNRAGTLHADADCHFLRRSPAVATLTGRPALVDDLIAGTVPMIKGDPETALCDDGTTPVLGWCLYCAASAAELASV